MPRNPFLTLKNLGILKTRRVRAGVTVKYRRRRIPVIFGRRQFQNTHLQGKKLAYYQNVNRSHCTERITVPAHINKDNLITIPRSRLVTIFQSVNTPLSVVDSFTTMSMCLMNTRSISNKT